MAGPISSHSAVSVLLPLFRPSAARMYSRSTSRSDAPAPMRSLSSVRALVCLTAPLRQHKNDGTPGGPRRRRASRPDGGLAEAPRSNWLNRTINRANHSRMHLALIARTRLAEAPLALPRGRPMTLGAACHYTVCTRRLLSSLDSGAAPSVSCLSLRRYPALAREGDNREPGVNPGLPRSGKRERPSSLRTGSRELGSDDQ